MWIVGFIIKGIGMSKLDKQEVAGCGCLVIIFVAVLLGSITLCYQADQSRKELSESNKELLSHRFEVKEIFAEKHGNKPANSYIAYQCIVEDIETKERVMARFDDDTLPVTGDIWRVQLVELYNNQGKEYRLHEKIRDAE